MHNLLFEKTVVFILIGLATVPLAIPIRISVLKRRYDKSFWKPNSSKALELRDRSLAEITTWEKYRNRAFLGSCILLVISIFLVCGMF
jgi:hypothetical protein